MTADAERPPDALADPLAADEHGDECAICLMPLSGTLSHLDCGHTFHEACLEELRSHLHGVRVTSEYSPTIACPLCRAPVDVQADPAQLAAVVRGSDPESAINAARALGLQGDRAAGYAATLAERLGDDNVNMRRVAVWSLGHFSAEPLAAHASSIASCLGDSDKGVQYFAKEVLKRLGEPGVMALVQQAVEPGSTSRARTVAAQTLQKMGYLAAVAFVEYLTHPDPKCRQRAVAALGHLGETSSPHAEALASCLSDDNAEVRCSAAWALGCVSGSEAAPHVEEVAALLDDAAGAQKVAIKTLGKIGRAAAPHFDALLHLLQSPDVETEVKSHLVEAIGRIRAACVEEGCSGLTVSNEVLATMAHLLIDADADVRKRTLRAVTQMGLMGATMLACQLRHKDVHIRGTFVDALRQMGQFGAAGFAGALQDSDATVRTVAAGALGRMGDEVAVHSVALTLACQDPESSVRQAANNALGYISCGLAMKRITGPDPREMAKAVARQVVEIRRVDRVAKRQKAHKKMTCCVFKCWGSKAKYSTVDTPE